MEEPKPILILGDVNLDRFVYVKCERLCPEGPAPVLCPEEVTENMGMAGNVFRQVQCLGYPVELICNENYKEITKVRYLQKKPSHLFVRIDTNDKISKAQNIEKINYNKFSAIICSDYNKGFLDESQLEFISKSHPLTWLDSKKVLGNWAKNFKYIKINRAEYKASEKQIKQCGLSNKIIQTIGSGGTIFRGKTFPVKEIEIVNLSGSGDGHLAAMVVDYVQNQDIERAIRAGNDAATILVQRRALSLIKD